MQQNSSNSLFSKKIGQRSSVPKSPLHITTKESISSSIYIISGSVAHLSAIEAPRSRSSPAKTRSDPSLCLRQFTGLRNWRVGERNQFHLSAEFLRCLSSAEGNHGQPKHGGHSVCRQQSNWPASAAAAAAATTSTPPPVRGQSRRREQQRHQAEGRRWLPGRGQ